MVKSKAAEQEVRTEKDAAAAQAEREARHRTLEAALAPKMPKERFVRELLSTYRWLKHQERVPEPIPVARLRRALSERTGLTSEEVGQFLEITSPGGPNFTLTLLPPKQAESGGLTIEGRYYHFVSIKEVERFYCPRCGEPFAQGVEVCPKCRWKRGPRPGAAR